MKTIRVTKFGTRTKSDAEITREGQKLICKYIDEAVMAAWGLVKAKISTEEEMQEFLEEAINFYTRKYAKMGEEEYLDSVFERHGL